MPNGEAMSKLYAEIGASDEGIKLARIHEQIMAAIHAADKPAERRARRCYRRALTRIGQIERWRRLNGYTS